MKEPKAKRRKLDPESDMTLFGSKVDGSGISNSLKSFIQSRILNSLEAIALDSAISIVDTSNKLYEQLQTCGNDNNWSNKEFSDNGSKLFKVILLAKNNTQLIEQMIRDDWNCLSLIRMYDTFIKTNKVIYEHIQTHHKYVSEKEWTDVAQDSSALNKYCEAAHAMGDKVWVYEANQWMTQYAIKYFHDGGAKRHYQKMLRQQKLPQLTNNTTTSNHNTPKSVTKSKDELSTYLGRNKLQLLDVGSCYNPLNTAANAEYFDITAIDLCPATNSVYQCDFLTVQLSSSITFPVIEHLESHAVAQEISKDNENSNTNSNKLKITTLPISSYHVLTMSLVLCYLPSPEAREKMIDHARALLISSYSSQEATENDTMPAYCNGLLIIVEKQSILAVDELKRQIKQKKLLPTISSSSSQAPQQQIPASEEDPLLQQEQQESKDKENKEEVIAHIPTVQDWKEAICARGFTSVTYQFLAASDGRKAHILVFAAAPLPIKDNIQAIKKRLWIKQDFFGQDLRNHSDS